MQSKTSGPPSSTVELANVLVKTGGSPVGCLFKDTKATDNDLFFSSSIAVDGNYVNFHFQLSIKE